MLHVPGARRRVLPGLAAAVLLLGGCGDLDDSAAAQGISQSDLVSELAAQLTRSATLTYAAGYQLAGGGTTVFLTTQYLDEAEKLADRISILHQGTIIVSGTLAELRKLLPPAQVEYVERQPTLEEIFLAIVGKEKQR